MNDVSTVSAHLERINNDVNRGLSANKTQISKLSEKQGELQERMQDVEQKLARPRGEGRVYSGGGAYGATGPGFGYQVEAAFKENAGMFQKTRSLTLDV